MLTRTCPLVVIHQPPYLPARGISQREHGTYEPTSLVSPRESNLIWTSPLISSNVTPSMNLPAHGTASPDPSKASLSVKTTHQEAKNNSISAWLGPLAARLNCSRRQRSPRPTVFSSPPGGAHRAARRLLSADSLTLRLSPGGYQPTARRHTRSFQQLIFGTLTDLVPTRILP